MDSEVREIPVDSIRPSKFPLRPIDDKVVGELMQSIEARGLLQPIMVRPLGDNSWELIFGNHRLEACKRLGWKTIPCRVREMDDAKAFMTVEVENLQKNNFIDPIAEAKGFQLLREQGLTEADIGKGIGKTQQYASARLGLLRLEPEIQALVTSGLVPGEHAYELSKIEDAKKRGILAGLSRNDQDGSLTLKELRDMAKQPLDELAMDPRVDRVLMQDPTERIKRVECKLDGIAGSIPNQVTALQKRVSQAQLTLEGLQLARDLLVVNGIFKREHCCYYDGAVCVNWQWAEKPGWNMKRDGNRWKLLVIVHPEFCATCPTYKEKALPAGTQPTLAQNVQ